MLENWLILFYMYIEKLTTKYPVVFNICQQDDHSGFVIAIAHTSNMYTLDSNFSAFNSGLYFSPWSLRFSPGRLHMRFVADKVSLRRLCFKFVHSSMAAFEVYSDREQIHSLGLHLWFTTEYGNHIF
jgi:hypothetical protein